MAGTKAWQRAQARRLDECSGSNILTLRFALANLEATVTTTSASSFDELSRQMSITS